MGQLPSPEQRRPNGRMHGDYSMSQFQRVAFIGNHLPRRCGIATFTHDLHRAISMTRPDLETCVVAMTNPGCSYDYPPALPFQIREEEIAEHAQAPDLFNTPRSTVHSLHPEYPIF